MNSLSSPLGGDVLEKEIYSINPWFITGFTHAEGCFTCSVIRRPNYKAGWEINLAFQIRLHRRDLKLLLAIQQSLKGIGYISYDNTYSRFRVSKLSQILEVISFFDKYPLISQKRGDYLLFKQIVYILLNKEHFTVDGIQRIVNIKASLNLGLSSVLKEAFPDTVAVTRLWINNYVIPHPSWIAGFVAGEGHFFVSTSKGAFKSLLFKITQHNRDRGLLDQIKIFFNCGTVYLRKESKILDFKVTNFSLINDIIIPFFKINGLLGVKSEDFKDWSLMADMVKNSSHKSEEGLKNLAIIKARMNRMRYK